MNQVDLREQFRKFLVEATDCALQEGENGASWPCGTCTISLLTNMGLDSSKPEYSERVDEPDRINEVWRAILQIRDAKLKNEPSNPF